MKYEQLICYPPTYTTIKIIEKDSHLLLHCKDKKETDDTQKKIDGKKLFGDTINLGRKLYKILENNIEPLNSYKSNRWYESEFLHKTIMLKGPINTTDEIRKPILKWISKYGIPCPHTKLFEKGDDDYQDPCTIMLYPLIDLSIFTYILFDYYNNEDGNIEKLFSKDFINELNKKVDNKNPYHKVINKCIFFILNNIWYLDEEPHITFSYDSEAIPNLAILFTSIYQIMMFELKKYVTITCRKSCEISKRRTNKVSINQYTICKNCEQNFCDGKSEYCFDCKCERDKIKNKKLDDERMELCRNIEELYKKFHHVVTDEQIKEISEDVISKTLTERRKVDIKKARLCCKYLKELEKSQQ